MKRSADDFPFYMTASDAREYVGCRTMKGWYSWRLRHGIVSRSNGTVCRLDLDRVLNRKRKPRKMNAASLANLEQGRGRSQATAASN